MGYITSATTTTLTARLTPFGRTMLIQSDTSLITSFSLGDSDANYATVLPLTPGEVPSNAGNIGAFSSFSNSVAKNVGIKSALFVNSTGAKFKAVEAQSSAVTLDLAVNGNNTASGATITQNIISRANINTDALVNLYYTFNLPLDSSGDYRFTGLTSNFGGLSNTSLSAISQTKILVVGIDNSKYGELIDGKTIKLQITTTASSFTLYSTYQNTGAPLSVQDANYSDAAPSTQFLGSNTALLFSDDILNPNGGNTSLSWATGWNTTKPFALNAKQQYNIQTNTSLGQTADTMVGIAYLDKGFMVITHPTIVNNFDVTATAITATCNSVSSVVTQNITCIADRGEFGTSTNPTFRTGDTVRISEVGLYDASSNLIAIAKTDRHVLKNVNDFFALGIKLFI